MPNDHDRVMRDHFHGRRAEAPAGFEDRAMARVRLTAGRPQVKTAEAERYLMHQVLRPIAALSACAATVSTLVLFVHGPKLWGLGAAFILMY